MTPLRELPDAVVMALTIYGEARDQPVLGQIAVGCVIRNRLKRAINTAPRWRDICLAPKQFSCFNTDDPKNAENAAAVAKAAEQLMAAFPPRELQQALWIAEGVRSGALMDVTHGATHYLTTKLLATDPPKWAKGQPVLVTIQDHAFLHVP